MTKVGKRENLVSAAHCATRLRLVLADNAKCGAKAVEDIDGVKGVFSASGQLQIILGTGTVNKVYGEFIAISGLSAATKEEVKAAAAAKQPLLQRMVKALGDVFVPILPAIVASGLMMGLVEALGYVIPVIIAVWLMCFIEKRLHKVVPETIDLFVTLLVWAGPSAPYSALSWASAPTPTASPPPTAWSCW